MADQFTAEWKKLSADVTQIGSRIRRYRLDPLLRRSDLAQPVFKREPAAVLVSRADGEAAIQAKPRPERRKWNRRLSKSSRVAEWAAKFWNVLLPLNRATISAGSLI